MRISVALIACQLFIFNCVAQNEIPNPGFEYWEQFGTIFNNYEEPVGWSTSNAETVIFQFQTATKVEDDQFVYSGNYALKLRTHYIGILNLSVPGGVATADLNINLAIQSIEASGGVPFSLRPSALQGWYQYIPAAQDSARIGMLLSRWNPVNQLRDTVATAIFETTELTNGYIPFSTDFEYQSELNPDTMIIGILCGKVVDPPEGTEMYVDDLSLVYDAVSSFQNKVNRINAFPNPARNRIFYNAPSAEIIELWTVQGVQSKTYNVLDQSDVINVEHVPPGLYIMRFYTSSGRVIGQSRITIMP